MELEDGEHSMLEDGLYDYDVEYPKKNVSIGDANSDAKQENYEEKPRDTGKHRYKEGRRRRNEEEQQNRDREGSRNHGMKKEREKEPEKQETRDKHRNVNREKRKEDREEHRKMKEHEDLHKEKIREKDYGHSKYWDKDGVRDKECQMEHKKSKDRGREHSKDRDKDRGREKDYDRGRERHHGRDKVMDWEKERGSENHHSKDRDKEREQDREHDRVKGKEKERDKGRDREREKEKETVKELDDFGRGKGMGRSKGKERDKDRAREAEREAGFKPRDHDFEKYEDKGKEGVKAERSKETTDNDSDAVNKNENITVTEEGEMVSTMSLGSTTELGERLIKMKEERLMKPEGVSEVLSWVNRSRKLEEKMNAEKVKAVQLSRIFEEQDHYDEESEGEERLQHTAKDLAGVKILHGLDKVVEGGAVVLTLKDQNILANGEINEEVDMLENVELGEQKQRDEAYKAAKNKTRIYDDKFSGDVGSQRTILPQYDEFVQDEGIALDESGRFSGDAEKKLEELRKRLEGVPTNNQFQDLTSCGKFSSDYYSHAEMLQFNKPKRHKSLRKKAKLDLDASETDAISAGLATGDLGSRNNISRLPGKEIQEKSEAERRRNAYQSAVAKAEEASRVLQMEHALTFQVVEEQNPVFGEDEDELYRSMEKARKLALKKKEDVSSGPQAVAHMALGNKHLGDEQNPSFEEEPHKKKVVFTEMEEFVSGLQLNEEFHKPVTDYFMDEADHPKPLEKVKNEELVVWTDTKNGADESPVKEVEEDIQPDAIIIEPAIGKGLSGALQLLKERGTLKESIDWGGRNMDKKKSKLVGIHDDADVKDIRLERLDEFGRVMTPKEAFRKISHIFHGKGPGKMKMEKRMKQYHEELKLKQMKTSDTPSQAMERMREAQAQLKTPYLVLSGHIKPGQTSDPRSGFATVEKDPGSLTPMLGDRKVEHFLGIKRKDEQSNMDLFKKPRI